MSKLGYNQGTSLFFVCVFWFGLVWLGLVCLFACTVPGAPCGAALPPRPQRPPGASRGAGGRRERAAVPRAGRLPPRLPKPGGLPAPTTGVRMDVLPG